MATIEYAAPSAGHLVGRGAQHHRPQQAPIGSAPPGTFAPGTKVQVGSHRVVIEKYLSEGGFAHVYVVRVPIKDNKYETAVLKRVAVPDKDALANMRTEVETMKKLQGHKHIVRYIDSHASQLKGGGYEVFLLMEYCAGGGLIDFMNTRLQYRLTEPEILNIFSDVAEGVATMHYLKPPLLHRDLKVENILISAPPATTPNALYKLCDFGSTAPPRPAATNAAEARLIEDDVQRHTTMQYRSPEMIDVWRRQPIDEKSDIWALGVLLYKLCYYTTPFEEVGQMAILNAKFKFPHHPFFSQRLRALIGAMLKEAPKDRPNIYQVIKEVCNIRGTAVPIKDIYANRSQSTDAKNQRLPPTSPQVASPPPPGISVASPVQEKDVLPDITPMRRGRPTAPTQQSRSTKPSPSPVKGDPFAALDSKNYKARVGAVDEISKKFPSIDEFSITVNKQPGFEFSKEPTKPALNSARDTTSKPSNPAPASVRPSEIKSSERTMATPADTRSRPYKSSSSLSTDNKQLPAQPMPTKSNYVSTGTMTSSTPPPQMKPAPPPTIASRPIWRVPDHSRSESLPRISTTANGKQNSAEATARSLQPSPHPETQSSKTPAPATGQASNTKQPTVNENVSSLNRARSTNSRPRPVSAAYVGSNLDYLRDHETIVAKSPPAALGSRRSSRQQLSNPASNDESKPIKDDTAYLRSLEQDEDQWERQELNSLSMRSKRANKTPEIIKDDAKVFSTRHNSAADKEGASMLPQDDSPAKDYQPNRPLSPVAASEATSASPRPTLADTSGLEDTEDLPQEMRREMERQLQIQEEKRVAEAAATYRDKPPVAPQVSRASTIQQRVQSLLEEGRSAPITRTAAGYGRYTDSGSEDVSRRPLPENSQVITPTDYASPRRSYATAAPKPRDDLVVAKQRIETEQPLITGHAPVSASAPPGVSRTGPRPAAKPKPVGLRSGVTGQITYTGRSPTGSPSKSEWQSAANDKAQGSRLAALLARDQEGVAEAGPGAKLPHDAPMESPTSGSLKPKGGSDVLDERDWELEFSKRYPSLSGIELVETDLGSTASGVSQRELRIKDV